MQRSERSFYKDWKRTQRSERSFKKNRKERKDRKILWKRTDAQPWFKNVSHYLQFSFCNELWPPEIRYNFYSRLLEKSQTLDAATIVVWRGSLKQLSYTNFSAVK